MVLSVVFFKQKTAYEMRISDWSSDVCSSDLIGGHQRGDPEQHPVDQIGLGERPERSHDHQRDDPGADADRMDATFDAGPAEQEPEEDAERDRRRGRHRPPRNRQAIARSEEHTSELQSLMRISYAVFCLKTKNTT